MKSQIIYRRNSKKSQQNGRSGHILKDLFTSVILGQIFDLDVIYGQEWKEQDLLTCVPYNLRNPDFIPVQVKGKNNWKGISESRFRDLSELIGENSQNRIFEVSGVFRIHLFQVHEWEEQGLISKGVFQKCLEVLNKLYWGSQSEELRCGEVAIHARRGDVAAPGHKQYFQMGPGTWNAGYYQTMINGLANCLNPSCLTIFSEKENAEDLLKLEKACLELGDDSHVNAHFRKMVTAEYFVPSCSSLSTWAAYLSLGTVLIPNQQIKHFSHPEKLSNWQDLVFESQASGLSY